MKGAASNRIVGRLCRRLLGFNSTEMTMNELRRSALVFSPHPDDESLGCGGTIIKKKMAGATIGLVFMTDGSAATHANLISREQLKTIRMSESRNACRVLGLDNRDIYFLAFEDSKLTENIAVASKRVVEVLEEVRPEEVYVPYLREPIYQAPDHVATTRIVFAALARQDRSVTVWEYPVWFWLHWPWVGLRQGHPPIIKTWPVFRNSVLSLFGIRALMDLRYSLYIGDVLSQKRAALSQHKSQMQQLLHDPRWLTLVDICNGQFLRCFCEDREFFRRCEYQGTHATTSYHS